MSALRYPSLTIPNGDMKKLKIKSGIRYYSTSNNNHLVGDTR